MPGFLRGNRSIYGRLEGGLLEPALGAVACGGRLADDGWRRVAAQHETLAELGKLRQGAV